MLIYNYQKEFVGIDESDLKALGFSNLSQLRSESADFANLFVKTPGFVHNFKHVHWIDFVTCADSNEESKVIIHANSKNYQCTLDIKTAYLVDDPSQKAYLINLVNLRTLTHGENEQVAEDVLEKPAPKASNKSTNIFNTSDVNDDKHEKIVPTENLEDMEVTHDPYEASSTDTIVSQEINSNIVEDIYEDTPIELDDDLEEEIQEVPIKEPEVVKEPIIPSYNQVLQVGNDYAYDPHLASDELGLPVDLIEEFIQDFISQANEFKDDLYTSLSKANADKVKILSHKLKGVAANLRIEDAFEVLTTINTSDDNDEIETNIDTFYQIIEKLSTKGSQPTTIENIEEEDEDLILSFKDDNHEEPKIQDIDVPQKIEMPELADDDYLINSISKDNEIEEIDLNENIDEPEILDKITLDDEVENLEIIKDISPAQYDKAQAASEIGIDSENFEVLFNDFIEEGDKACSEINSAIEQGNAESWRSAAIKLKGMSDNMRLNVFTAELESIINSQNSNEAKEALNTISIKLQQIAGKKV